MLNAANIDTDDLDWLLMIAWRYIDSTSNSVEYEKMARIESEVHG